MTGAKAIVVGVALLLAASAALFTASAAEPARVAAATSPWQLVPGARMDVSQGVAEPFWAASRAWIPVAQDNVPVL